MSENKFSSMQKFTIGIWVAIICGLLVFFAYAFNSDKTIKPPGNFKASSGSSMGTSELPVETKIEYRDNYLIADILVKNNKGYHHQGKLTVYAVDSTGNRYYMDMFDIDLDHMEAGHSKASKLVSECGPSPHKIDYEWK